jgi:hypothetical protein
MTINWGQIKSDVADDISAAMAAAMQADFSQWPIPAIPLSATYTWGGSTTVLTSDTSEVSDSPSSFIRLESDGNWFKVVGIDENVSVTIEDIYSVGIPSGSGLSSKAVSGCPAPATSGLFRQKLGVPIADAIMDGVKDALDQAEINDVADDAGNTVGPGVIV